jgi:hypothetical protein
MLRRRESEAEGARGREGLYIQRFKTVRSSSSERRREVGSL